MLDTYCETCSLGYVLNTSVNPSNPSVCELNTTNTTSLQSNQKGQIEGSTSESSSGVIIGLAIWGTLMTMGTIVLVVLYLKKRNKSGTLLGDVEPERVRQVILKAELYKTDITKYQSSTIKADLLSSFGETI